ncbi:ferritin family protein [candidate division KSB1 bacterium]|nr:ferritin family protein [candidate division KSB1 bacterium]
MDHKEIGLLEAIEIAMEAELKAHQFYRDAIAKITNARGKNLLQQLADFEHNHYDKLTDLKKSLAKQGKFIEYEGTQFKPYKSAVPAEVAGKIEPDKENVLNILSLAIEAETKAAANYQKLAQETADPLGKDMFKKLSEEETLHRRILSDEFYQLSNRGEIWFWGD